MSWPSWLRESIRSFAFRSPAFGHDQVNAPTRWPPLVRATSNVSGSDPKLNAVTVVPIATSVPFRLRKNRTDSIASSNAPAPSAECVVYLARPVDADRDEVRRRLLEGSPLLRRGQGGGVQAPRESALAEPGDDRGQIGPGQRLTAGYKELTDAHPLRLVDQG